MPHDVADEPSEPWTHLGRIRATVCAATVTSEHARRLGERIMERGGTRVISDPSIDPPQRAIYMRDEGGCLVPFPVFDHEFVDDVVPAPGMGVTSGPRLAAQSKRSGSRPRRERPTRAGST